MKVSEITAFLENAYNVLNSKYFGGELPKVVITIQSSPNAYGHYTPWEAWKEEDTGFREINLGAETLDRPIENTIATRVPFIEAYIPDYKKNRIYENSKKQ